MKDIFMHVLAILAFSAMLAVIMAGLSSSDEKTREQAATAILLMP